MSDERRLLHLGGRRGRLHGSWSITRLNAVHALLYLIVSLLAVAVIFFALGAPFVAALEVIIYAGAIMVLFVFVIMMLNLGPTPAAQERRGSSLGAGSGPAVLAAVLLARAALRAGRGAAAPAAPATAVAPEAGRHGALRPVPARRRAGVACCCWPGWSAPTTSGRRETDRLGTESRG